MLKMLQGTSKAKLVITSEEQQTKIKAEKKFTKILKEEINEKKTITENMVGNQRNRIKRKKAGIRLGRKAEWISRMGKRK